MDTPPFPIVPSERLSRFFEVEIRNGLRGDADWPATLNTALESFDGAGDDVLRSWLAPTGMWAECAVEELPPLNRSRERELLCQLIAHYGPDRELETFSDVNP